MKRHYLTAAAITLFACGGAGDMAEYDRVVADASRCTAGDACVIAGGVHPCRCRAAIRSDAATLVEAAVDRAECPEGPERLFCPELSEPRCDGSRCLADHADP
jgi:hypothetical protein